MFNASRERIIFFSTYSTFTDCRQSMGLLSVMQRVNNGHKFHFCESLGEVEILLYAMARELR